MPVAFQFFFGLLMILITLLFLLLLTLLGVHIVDQNEIPVKMKLICLLTLIIYGS